MYKNPFLTVWIFLGLLLSQYSNTCLAGDIKQAQTSIITLIDSGQKESAQTNIDKLLADYSRDPDLPSVIYEIAGCYDLRRKTSSARQLYLFLTSHFPASVYADKARLDQVRLDVEAEIDAGNFPAAAASVEQMMAENPDNIHLFEILYHIAGRYEKCRRIDSARALYSRILESFPQDEQSSKTRLDIARLDVHLLTVSDRLDLARSSVDKLISDNSKNKYLAAALFNIAKGCADQYEYDEAKALYGRLINLFPENKYTSWARQEITKLNVYTAIDSDELSVASSLVEQYIKDNQADSYFPTVLYSIARYYVRCENIRWTGNIKQAKALFGLLSELYPDHYNTYRSILDIAAIDIFSSVTSGDSARAEKLTDNIINNYPEHPYLPEILLDIGCCYHKHYQYEQAKAVYNYLIEHHPQNYNSTLAVIELSSLGISSQIMTGDFGAARASIDKLIADFNDHPRLLQIILCITEKYYEKGLNSGAGQEVNDTPLGIAEELLERHMLGKPSNKDIRTWAYYMATIISYRRGEPERVVEFADKVLQTDPYHQYAADMQWLIADGYERMKASGQMPADEADIIIEETYEDLMENYPANSLSGYAAIHLGEINLLKGEQAKACAYFGWFLMNAASDDPRIAYINKIAERCGSNRNGK